MPGEHWMITVQLRCLECGTEAIRHSSLMGSAIHNEQAIIDTASKLAGECYREKECRGPDMDRECRVRVEWTD